MKDDQEKTRNPYTREQERIQDSDLSLKNKEILLRYLRKRRGQVNSVFTATKRVAMMRKVAGWIGKDLDAVNEDDILILKENIMGEPLRTSPEQNIHDKQKLEVWREPREYKLNTKVDYIRTIRHFYKFLGMAETIEPLMDIQVRYKTKFGQTIEDKHIDKVIASIKNVRNKAMLMVLHESGARNEEFLSLKISDLIRTDRGFKLRLYGKTGERRVPLIRSTPYLNRYLEIHPFEENTAFLWVSTQNKFWGRKIHTHGLYKIIRKSFKKAELDHLDTTPQNFRRSRATINARFMTEMVLEIFMGWSRGTKQTIHYVKMSGKDVDHALQAQYGLANTPIASTKNKAPKKCHVCKTENGYEARFCYNCGKPLDTEASLHAEKEFNSQMKATEDYLQKMMLDKQEWYRFKMFQEALSTNTG